MIADLDESLKQLLVKKGKLDSAAVDLSFDMPDREWSSALSKPTLNLYLYDIRENSRLRGTEWLVEKQRNGMATKRKNPSRIDLSYLVTVWTNDVADEHRLLWQALTTFFRFPVLPDDVLSGALRDQLYPIQTLAAQPDGLFSNPSDFWAALDNEIKPSLNLVITLALDLDVAFTAAQVSTRTFGFKQPDAPAERSVRITGRLRAAGKADKAVAGARIIAREVGRSAETDADGQYALDNLREGKHTLDVFVGGKKVKEVAITVPAKDYNLEV